MANLASISSPLSSPSSKNPRGSSSLSSPFHRHPLSLPLSSPFSTSAVSSHLVSSTKVHPFGLSARPNGSVTMVRAEAVGRVGVSTKNVLIVNTNGGGHAIIGFYLAKELLELGHAVTILTVGDEASDKMKKPPFSRFSEIVDAGGRTIWGDPADVAKVIGEASFDVVLENNGKDIDTVRPVADWANNTGVEQFLYISSAGIYKPVDELPHVEGDIVKDDASHVAVEKYISGLSFKSWSVFRPQYMIGSGNNKDCEEWFFDRIARDKPVPIPGSGMQVTSISHVRDLSSMLALAIEKPTEACGNIFNCVVDRAVTFDGLAKMCAQAAGREVKIVHYDPKSVGVDAKKAFPFRNMHFYAEPRTAKLVLGWSSTTNLPEDLKERFEEYVSIGRDKQAMKFDVDEMILESLKMAISS